MDKLDIFEMPMDAKIQTTIEELHRLYWTAVSDAANGKVLEDKNIIVHGDIV